jgi:hypothetical protein
MPIDLDAILLAGSEEGYNSCETPLNENKNNRYTKNNFIIIM